jgi:hypothetical protein
MTLHTLPLFELKSEPQGLVTGYAAVFGGCDSYGDCVMPGATLEEDTRGLRVEGLINLKTTAGRESFEHLRAGDLNGLSIGYQVPPGGSEYHDGVNLLKSVDLHEVSAVTIPADSSARITSVKTMVTKPATLRAFEQALEEIGLSRREARAVAAKGWSGLAAAPQGDESQELIAAITAATQLFSE